MFTSDIYLQIAYNNSSNQINWISNICQRPTLILVDRKHVKALNINVTRIKGFVFKEKEYEVAVANGDLKDH